MQRLRARSAILVACLTAALLSGCATEDLRRDHDRLRRVVLDLYTDQIIDNLILAKNDMPFIHIDYATITGNVTAKETASFGASQENDSSKAVAAKVFTSITRAFKSTFNFGTSGEHTNQVSMVGTPVNNLDDVYEAYFEYLSLPDALVVSDAPPPTCAAHICRKYCGKWYWVPVERRKEFLQLAMATTATRGKHLLAIPEFFPVQLTEIVGEKASNFAPGAVDFTLKLDKPIPNDDGRLELTIDKNTYSFFIRKNPVAKTEKTETLTLSINPARFPKEPKFENNFAQFRAGFTYSGKVYLEQHRPQQPTVKELIDSINNQLEIIKLNQLR